MDIKKMSKGKKILTIALIVVVAVLLVIGTYFSVTGIMRRIERNKAYDVEPLSQEQLDEIKNNDKAKKLMIVAHPDDDVIWGGAHLKYGEYYIVCITNGRNSTRRPEFEEMLEKSGNSGCILEYPDKVLSERDDWKGVWDKIKADLEAVMTCKDWELIVTHNRQGEYGHQHHKYSHQIVTEIYDRLALDEPLYNFGKYYSKKKLPDHEDTMVKVSQEEYDFKSELVKVYRSQENTVDKLWHMGYYEMWTQYERFSENPGYRK